MQTMAPEFLEHAETTGPGPAWPVLRFGLRTFFLSVLLLCVAFGWLGYNLQQASAQHAVVEKIHHAGGEVFYVNHAPNAELSGLQRLFGIDFCNPVRAVKFEQSHPVTRRDAENIAQLSRVDWVNLLGGVEGSALAPLSNLDKLQTVYIAGSFDDAGVKELVGSAPGLRRLILEFTKVSDEGLKHLAKLRSLEEITIRSAEVTDEGIIYLTSLPNVKTLNLDHLNLDGACLADFHRFRYLNVLDLTRVPLRDESLKYLVPVKSLRRLSLMESTVGDSGLVHLSKMAHLEALNLSATRITDGGLVFLEPLKQLKWVEVTSSELSAPAVERLQAALPNTRVRDDWLTYQKLHEELERAAAFPESQK